MRNEKIQESLIFDNYKLCDVIKYGNDVFLTFSLFDLEDVFKIDKNIEYNFSFRDKNNSYDYKFDNCKFDSSFKGTDLITFTYKTKELGYLGDLKKAH